MSGIVGLVDLTGAPIDRGLLAEMTEVMVFRGPDGRQVWAQGSVGFGQTFLSTTDESTIEQQPCFLDGAGGRLWIVADARIDARAELLAGLAGQGEDAAADATDAELILRSYRVWGEGALERLLGDFAFAIWDEARRRLFCARDQLGVKALYYARIGQLLVFSNTLDCVRRHPAVSARLNDQAIADFLLASLNHDPATTAFADVRRIPPGHFATWSQDEERIHRYWKMPVDEPIRYRTADDYTDRFKELVQAAVRDRLRGRKNVAVLMSGGIDSPTMAATACEVLRQQPSGGGVHAFTILVEGLDGDERRYAGAVAEHLGIPAKFVNYNSGALDPGWHRMGLRTSEPVINPVRLVADRALHRDISESSRVLFYGEGPDNALKYEWGPYLSHLIRCGRWGELVVDLGRHAATHRRIPLLSTIPAWFRLLFNNRNDRSSYPAWLNADFESRLSLRERYADLQKAFRPDPVHPLRPAAYASFQSPLWEAMFRGLDAEGTQAPMETRHPFVDLRVLRYMMAVPAVPWCRTKYLERRTMRGILPPSVLRRPKEPLAGDPIWLAANRLWSVPERSNERLAQYVNVGRMGPEPPSDRDRFWVDFRPLALNYWLQNAGVSADSVGHGGFR